MGITVPRSQAEAPVQSGNSIFPEGSWVGEIEQVRVRPFPDFVDPVAFPTRGYASKDGTILSIQLGGNNSTDVGGPETNQKMFVDFVIEDGTYTVEDGANIPEQSWQMQRSATLLTNLAIALGLSETVTDESGNEYTTTPDNYVSALQDGELNGRQVGFETYHRDWTSKAGKKGTDVELRQFFQVV